MNDYGQIISRLIDDAGNANYESAPWNNNDDIEEEKENLFFFLCLPKLSSIDNHCIINWQLLNSSRDFFSFVLLSTKKKLHDHADVAERDIKLCYSRAVPWFPRTSKSLRTAPAVWLRPFEAYEEIAWPATVPSCFYRNFVLPHFIR